MNIDDAIHLYQPATILYPQLPCQPDARYVQYIAVSINLLVMKEAGITINLITMTSERILIDHRIIRRVQNTANYSENVLVARLNGLENNEKELEKKLLKDFTMAVLGYQ